MENKRNNSRRGADTVLCRACLADCRPQQTKYLFGKWQPPTKSPATDSSSITIADMLCDITKTTARPGDKYPDQICSTCFQNFRTARTFIHRVRQSDKIMRKNWKYFQANHNKAPAPADESQHDRTVTRNASSRAKIEAMEKHDSDKMSDAEVSKNDTEKIKNNALKTKNNPEKIKLDTVVKTRNDTEKTKDDAVKSKNHTEKSKNNPDKTKNNAEKSKNDTNKTKYITDKTKNYTDKTITITDKKKSKIKMSDHLTQLVKRSPVVVLEKLVLDQIKKEDNWEKTDRIKEEIDIKNEILSDTENESTFPDLNQSDINNSYGSIQISTEIKLEEPDDSLQEDKEVLPEYPSIVATKGADDEQYNADNSQSIIDEKQGNLGADEDQHGTLLVKTGEVPAQLRGGREWTEMGEIYVKEEVDEEEVDVDLVCILCSKSFITIAGLKAHVISTHSYKWAVRVDALTQQLSCNTVLSDAFHCKICSKAFKTTEQLKEHMEGHVNRAREIAADKKGLGRNGRPRACKSTSGGAFHCVGCNLTQPTYKLLLLHAATCKKRLQLMGRFANNGDVQTDNHANISRPSRPKEYSDESEDDTQQEDNKNLYECKKCNQVFDGSLYLKIHKEIHHTALNGDVTEKLTIPVHDMED